MVGTKSQTSGARKPRARAFKRQVADIGFVPDFVTVDRAPLGQDDLDLLDRSLPTAIDQPWLFAALQDVAGSHIRARQQPQPSREEARHQLCTLVEMINNHDRTPSENAQLRKSIGRLNDFARSHLWGGLVAHPRNLMTTPELCLREPVLDFELIKEAAETALRRAKWRGDYGDPALSRTIQLLVDTYETATEKRATWSPVFRGPISMDGTQRQTAGSACGTFVHAFFSVVDQAVPTTQISNALRTYLGKRQRALATRGQSFAESPSDKSG